MLPVVAALVSLAFCPHALSVSVSHSICAVAVVAAAQRQLLVVVAVDFGAAPVIHTASIPTSWMPAHLVASAARSCLVPLRHLHTDTQIHTHIRTPHATRFYLFEMTFIGFYVFIWNFIKND